MRLRLDCPRIPLHCTVLTLALLLRPVPSPAAPPDVPSVQRVLTLLAAVGAVPAFAQHGKGPKVFLDYDQAELDAAYNQASYAPNPFTSMPFLAFIIRSFQ